MDKSPNWCPNCGRETEWLIVPSNPTFVKCKECGHIKKIPHLKIERPRLEKLSEKEKATVPSPKPIVGLGLALKVVLQTMLVGFPLGGI